MRSRSAVVAAVLVLALVAVPALAKKKKGATAPGTYSEWADAIDELEIVSTFRLADFERIVVEPFDTKDTPLPEKDDNTFEPVQEVLASPAAPFLEGLTGELSEPKAEIAAKNDSAKALVVRVKLVELDPGSQAARYWAGFGAGAARAKIEAEVIDGGSGKVLLRFTDERRSGVGAFGGDYVALLNRDLRELGEDLATLLKAF